VARQKLEPKSPPKKKFRLPLRYIDSADCLSHLAVEMDRLGCDINDSASAMRELWGDLRSGPDEHHIAEMHNPINFNIEALTKRTAQFAIPKPRIDLTLKLTSQDNLAVTWVPRFWGRQHAASDWVYWYKSDAYAGNRPSDELLFLRKFAFTRDIGSEKEWDRAYSLQIRRSLAQATIATINELKSRLSLNFDVRMITDIFPTWQDVDDGSMFGSSVLVGWVIESPVERKEREERSILAEWEKSHDVEIKLVIEALIHAAEKKKPGPGPISFDGYDTKASKALRAAGRQVMPKDVRDLRELLAKYEPNRLPEAFRPKTPEPPNNIVAFPPSGPN
jgi:hypothetical protein